ncbi:MAG: cation:proton antiporter [Leptospiraceae bacterium]|nr:MAG: cation:proton antiporter [Leptospiraceae bacterium]
MLENTLLQITLILILGTFSQWLANKLNIPSIILLLLSGFIAGPITNLIQPDQLMGNILMPFVSLSVALILYEGGLSLNIKDLKKTGGVILSILSIGVLITWILSSYFAYYFFKWPIQLAILTGAILTVTGPTVIIPLLRTIKPFPKLGSILKWEGIVVDAIGAILAILVFEGITSGEGKNPLLLAFFGILKTIIAGFGFGFLGGIILKKLLEKFIIPDHLQIPASLSIMALAYTLSDLIQHESGLFATIVMGLTLANQGDVPVKHIIHFKENLSTMLIGTLFILLSARLPLDSFQNFNLNVFYFILILILVIRPTSIFLSTLTSKLNLKEKIFLSWMAPRGIVAASVSSVFAYRLQQIGFEQANEITTVIFSVIIFTVVIYGFTAGPLANLLQLSAAKTAKGILFVGGHYWARLLAKELMKDNIPVLLVDTNPYHISAAKMIDLPAIQGNIIDENLLQNLDLTYINKMIALTSNDEVNTLACTKYKDIFGSSNVFQISPFGNQAITGDQPEELPKELIGRILFRKDLTYSAFTRKFSEGADILTIEIGKDITLQDWNKKKYKNILPLFQIDPDGNFYIYTEDSHQYPVKNKTKLIVLMDYTAN